MYRLLKLSAAFALLTIILCCNSVRKKNTVKDESINSQTILDSLDILVAAGGWFGGYGHPPTPEETRYNKISMALNYLPFSESEKLMADTNALKRVYGFSVACNQYFKKINSKHLELIKDTTPVMVYTSKGLMDAHLTVGQIATMVYESQGISRRDKEKETFVIRAVNNFIKGYSVNPDSYQPLVFDHYSWGSVENVYSYEIRHIYEIELNNKERKKVTQYFILDNDFKVNLIEYKRSSTFFCHVPCYDDWLEKYGRTLNANDSLDLRIK